MAGLVESHFFYFPSREVFVTPPGVRDVSIETSDGHTLHAWLMGPVDDHAAPVILHLHWNAGNVSNHSAFSEFLANSGYRVLLVDYRGYGRSEANGRLTRHRLLGDAQHALEWIREQSEFEASPIGVYGVSLGGAFATALVARNDDISALCLTSAFSSWRGVAGDHVPILPRLLIGRGLDPEDEIGAVGSCPVLIVHGAEDSIVPERHLEVLASAARRGGVAVETALIPFGGHNDVPSEYPEARRAIAEFFGRTLIAP
jgi:dipeptidyl aminopeptidase/acylaminoacyl peptidase